MATQSNPLNLSKHLHTWKRMRDKPKYYRCTHPDCPTTLPKEAIKGKRAECCICHKPFIIDELLIERANIHCHGCTGKAKNANTGCFGFDERQKGAAHPPTMTREEIVASLNKTALERAKGK